MNGPFGNYEGNCVGAILNTLARVENVPVNTIERLQVEGEFLKDNGEVFGIQKWFPELNKFLFYLYNSSCSQQRLVICREEKLLKPDFRLQLSLNRMACFQLSDQPVENMVETHRFIRRMLTNYVDDPCYKLHQDAGAFFQSGSHREDVDYILVEFWKPEGAQAFIDYMNANLQFKL